MRVINLKDMITLFHGSPVRLTPSNDRGRLYFSTFVSVANEYILASNNNEHGAYGFIYSIEVDEKDIVFTDNIDQHERTKGVLYEIDSDYYRIDLPENYQFKELNDKEILGLWK